MKLLKAVGAAVGLAFGLAGIGALYVQIAGIPRYEVEKVELHVDRSPERLARGKKLTTLLCAGCHLNPTTQQLTGKQLVDVPAQFGVVYSRNITRHPTKGIGSWTEGEIAYLLRTGVGRTGEYIPPWMPKLPHLADDDLNALIAFLGSDDPLVAPVDTSPPGVSQPTFLSKLLCRLVFKKLPFPKQRIEAPPVANKVAYGRYVVTAYDCFGCHSASFQTMNISEPERSAGYLGGGNELNDSRGGHIRSANLTFDLDTGIGRWSEADLARALRQGFRPDNTPLRPPMGPMPELGDDEVAALYAYLGTVPKIRNAVPHELPVAQTNSHVSEGRRLYDKYGCVACHGETGLGQADLRAAATHFPTRPLLEAWLRDAPRLKPGTRMPGWQGIIADAEYDPLISYILQLGVTAPRGGG